VPIEHALHRATRGCKSLLNVGCGFGKFTNDLSGIHRAGVDGFGPDLSRARLEERFHGLVQEVLPTIGDGSYDLVLGLDIIEHMYREDAEAAVEDMKRIAAVRVALFIPEGNHPQPGTKQNPLQEHLSSWWADDVRKLGFDVEVWRNFHNEPGKDRGALWATWER